MRSDVTSLVDAQLWYVGDGEGHLLYYSAWRNGVLLEQMKSELQELSPIFSTRAVTFLRF